MEKEPQLNPSAPSDATEGANEPTTGERTASSPSIGMEETKRIDTREVLRAQASLLEKASHAVPVRDLVPVDTGEIPTVQGERKPSVAPSERVVGRPVAPQPTSWWTRYWKLVLVASVTTLLVTAAVGVALAVNAMKNPAEVLVRTTPGATSTASTTGNADSTAAVGVVQPTETAPDYQFDENQITVLILGTDLSKKRQEQGMNARSDTLMLASINLETKKISLISIPRDTYTKIYGKESYLGYYGKINAAFAYGGGLSKSGVDYAVNTVSHFLGGVPIDYFVTFDMDLVKQLVDAIGGLKFNMDLDVTISGHKFTPGWTTLDGAAVLRYARHRHSSGGDFGRVDRQQKIIVALFEQLKENKQLSSVPKLYDAVKENLTTNMDPLQIAALAWFGMDVDVESITRYTIPGSTMTINGSSIVVANQEEKATILKAVFGIDVPFRSEESASYMQNLIKKAYSNGKSIVTTAQNFLDNNKGYYTSAEASGLKSAIYAWNKAYGRRDSEEMADCQLDVETEYNVLYGKVGGRKEAVEAGKDKISWAQNRLSKYSDYISSGDRATIESLIAAVQSCVDNKDYAGVGDATNRLESTALPIFEKAKEDMNSGGSDTDEPEATPTPDEETEEPADTPTPETSTPEPEPTPEPTPTESDAVG